MRPLFLKADSLPKKLEEKDDEAKSEAKLEQFFMMRLTWCLAVAVRFIGNHLNDVGRKMAPN